MAVAQLVVGAMRVHGDGRAGRDDILPGHAPHALVEQRRVAGVHATDHERDAGSKTRPQAHLQTRLGGSEKRHAATERPDAPGAQPLQLLGEKTLQTGKAAGEEFIFDLFDGSHECPFRNCHGSKKTRALKTRVFAVL